jgi:hypothetical protein
LPEPIGEHRARWRNVDDVGSAILLAQAVVDGCNVEKDQPTLASHVGRFQQHFGREIGENERDAAVGKLGHRRRGIGLAGKPYRFERE